MRDTQCETNQRSELPSDFSIEDYFQGEFGIWRSNEKHRVIVEFDAAAAEYVRSRKVHETQRLAPIVGGGIRLTMTVGDLTPVVSWILEWVRECESKLPELLRRVTNELRQALRVYDSTSSDPKKTKSGRKDSR